MNDTKGTQKKSRSSPDARAVRSREAMRAALLHLLENHALEDISIRDVVSEAGVGYATFYRHYSVKEELLDDVAAGEIDRLVELSLPALGTTNSAAASLVLCQYVHDHWSIWSTLLTGGAAAAMKEELLNITREIAAGWKPAKHRLPTDLRRALSTSMIIEILVWWLKQDKPLPVEEVAAIFDEAVISPLVNEGFD